MIYGVPVLPILNIVLVLDILELMDPLYPPRLSSSASLLKISRSDSVALVPSYIRVYTCARDVSTLMLAVAEPPAALTLNLLSDTCKLNPLPSVPKIVCNPLPVNGRPTNITVALLLLLNKPSTPAAVVLSSLSAWLAKNTPPGIMLELIYVTLLPPAVLFKLRLLTLSNHCVIEDPLAGIPP